MNKQDLIPLVEQECRNLRKYATEQEIAQLDDATIDAESVRGCIYGTMANHCRSERAQELIKNCCVKVIGQYESDLQEDIQIVSPGAWKSYSYISPIEHFIARIREKEGITGTDRKAVRAVVNMLKGKTDKIEY